MALLVAPAHLSAVTHGLTEEFAGDIAVPARPALPRPAWPELILICRQGAALLECFQRAIQAAHS
eukprot:10815950-Alexandrium_andersonii.AAC.1